MLLSPSPRGAELAARVRDFIDTEIRPIERDYHATLAVARQDGTQWAPLPLMLDLQSKARSVGLWNLFLPAGHGDSYAGKFGTSGSAGLSNVDYAPLAELMGRSCWLPWCSTATPPTPATPRSCCATATTSNRSSGSNHCWMPGFAARS